MSIQVKAETKAPNDGIVIRGLSSSNPEYDLTQHYNDADDWGGLTVFGTEDNKFIHGLSLASGNFLPFGPLKMGLSVGSPALRSLLWVPPKLTGATASDPPNVQLSTVEPVRRDYNAVISAIGITYPSSTDASVHIYVVPDDTTSITYAELQAQYRPIIWTTWDDFRALPQINNNTNGLILRLNESNFIKGEIEGFEVYLVRPTSGTNIFALIVNPDTNSPATTKLVVVSGNEINNNPDTIMYGFHNDGVSKWA